MTFVETNIRAFTQWMQHHSLPSTLIQEILTQQDHPEAVSETVLEWCERDSAINEELAKTRKSLSNRPEIIGNLMIGPNQEPPEGEKKAVEELVKNLIQGHQPTTEKDSPQPNQTLPNKDKV